VVRCGEVQFAQGLQVVLDLLKGMNGVNEAQVFRSLRLEYAFAGLGQRPISVLFRGRIRSGFQDSGLSITENTVTAWTSRP
jgi:hypothetical protein